MNLTEAALLATEVLRYSQVQVPDTRQLSDTKLAKVVVQDLEELNHEHEVVRSLINQTCRYLRQAINEDNELSPGEVQRYINKAVALMERAIMHLEVING